MELTGHICVSHWMKPWPFLYCLRKNLHVSYNRQHNQNVDLVVRCFHIVGCNEDCTVRVVLFCCILFVSYHTIISQMSPLRTLWCWPVGRVFLPCCTSHTFPAPHIWKEINYGSCAIRGKAEALKTQKQWNHLLLCIPSFYIIANRASCWRRLGSCEPVCGVQCLWLGVCVSHRVTYCDRVGRSKEQANHCCDS